MQTGTLSQSRRLFVKLAIIIAIATAIGFHLFGSIGALRWLEAGSYDAKVRWASKYEKADPQIVIIDIDNPSFEILKDKLGRWPWSRRVWTETVRYVAKGKPKAIAVDIKFSGNEDPQVDQEFADVIKQAGNVVLAYSFDPATVQGDAEETKSRMAVLAREQKAFRDDMAAEWFEAPDVAPNVPLPLLADSAAALGCVNSHFDRDGVVRRVPIACRIGPNVYRSFPAAISETATTQRLTAKIDGFHLGDAKANAPLDDETRLLLRWQGANPYVRVPLWQLICSIYPDQCPNNETKYPADFFKDKIVLLGASFSGSFELHPSPFNNQQSSGIPGIVVHATAVDDLLHGKSIGQSPTWLNMILIVGAAALGASAVIFIDGTIITLAISLVLAAIFAMVNVWAFTGLHMSVPLAVPLLAFSISSIGAGVAKFATTGRDLRHTRATLDRYMSPQLVNYVMENPSVMETTGERRELTIFFSDIRSFTTLTEKSEPAELIELLNEYLTAMTDVIFKYDGVCDKFIGDGILAHWGAFNGDQNHAELAARASLEMLERLKEMNQRWQAKGRQPIAIGIGINTGDVVLGNMGAGKKIEFTVIGDPVNLAARLEGLNKEYKTSIIVSEFTAAKLGNIATLRPLGGVKVKGKTIETQIFELQGISSGAQAAPEVRTGASNV